VSHARPDRARSTSQAAAGILFVELSQFPSYGGSKRVVVNLAQALDREHFEPRVLFYRDGPWVADLELAGIPVSVFEAPSPQPASDTARSGAAGRAPAWLNGAGSQVSAGGEVRRSALRRTASDLRSWWRLLGPDRAQARRLVGLVPAATRLIHVNSSMAADYSWFHVARHCRVPFVMHEHGIWRPRRAAYRSVAARAASVLCLTQERLDRLRDHLHGRVRADLLPNGIPVDRLMPARDRASVRAELGVTQDLPLIITAGHLQEWKGQALAVEAAIALAARGLDFLWILCGEEVEPAYAEALRRRIAAAGLSASVRLLGARADLPDLFAASDLAVHTSIQPEPFGLVVLEAMLQGLPVIGPREGAIPTLVRDGVDGVLVPPRDAGALAAAVLDLLKAQEARCAMGRAASSRVRESFDVKCQARKLEAIYERALSGAP
jgi:glycosyltransferase involved in cell wall biosynthesis